MHTLKAGKESTLLVLTDALIRGILLLVTVL
nr:MAG TPA: hypothetical protein [Herelleviridae sp.]